MVVADEKISYTDPQTGRKVILKVSHFEKLLLDVERLKNIINNHADILRENNLILKMDADVFEEADLTSEKEANT